MTREDAIEKLELMRQKVDEETYRALVLAIKALSQEPNTHMEYRMWTENLYFYQTDWWNAPYQKGGKDDK